MVTKEQKYWGISPALDLNKELEKILNFYNKSYPDSGNQIYNILLLGINDGRHILKTLANVAKHSIKYTNIYVVEDSYISICRQLFFFHLLCDNLDEKSLLETAEVYLESFGNTLVRYNTYQTICEYAELLKTQIDLNLQDILPFVSVNELRHKDLTELRKIFDQWSGEFERSKTEESWENKLRKNLGTRYDCRRNIFDWDFHTQLEDCEIISLNKYIKWRETGIAFKCREGRYVYANPTIFPQIRKNMIFEGDVCSSPYIAYGIESDQKDVLKIVNGVYQNTSEDVSLFNIIKFLKDLKLLQPLQDHVKIHFMFDKLEVGNLKEENIQDYFDVIVISGCETNFKSIADSLKPKGILLMETLKYAIDKTKEYKNEYHTKLKTMIEKAGLIQCDMFDFKKHSSVAFGKPTFFE